MSSTAARADARLFAHYRLGAWEGGALSPMHDAYQQPDRPNPRTAGRSYNPSKPRPPKPLRPTPQAANDNKRQAQSDRTIAELCRPLSAKALARHWRPPEETEAELTEWAMPPANGRMPILEEYASGRISLRHMEAARAFGRVEGQEETASGGRRSADSEIVQSFLCRDPLALWPAEAAAEIALAVHKAGGLMVDHAPIIASALAGAEMRDLAPVSIPVPKAKRAAAGRLRLQAALEIQARIAERGGELSQLEKRAIEMDFAEKVWALAAKPRGGKREGAGRPVAANDNNKPMALAA